MNKTTREVIRQLTEGKVVGILGPSTILAEELDALGLAYDPDTDDLADLAMASDVIVIDGAVECLDEEWFDTYVGLGTGG